MYKNIRELEDNETTVYNEQFYTEFNDKRISKKIVLYHRQCRDGFASAAVIYNKFGESANYYGIDPSKLEEDINKIIDIENKDRKFEPTTLILSADIGFKYTIYENLKKLFGYVKIIDHHKTTDEEFLDKNNKDLYFNNNYCGCVLAFKYFNYNKAVPPFLLYIQDRDLFKETMPDSKAIGLGLLNKVTYKFHKLENNLPNYNKPNFKEWLIYIDKNNFTREKEIGEILEHDTNRNIQMAKSNAIKMSMVVDNKTYKVSVINIAHLISDVGNILAKENPDIDFVLLYRIVGIELFVSLRSYLFDTTIIATFYGGGGHRFASGFTTTIDKMKIIKLENEYIFCLDK